MQRFVLALALVAIIATVFGLAARKVVRTSQQHDGIAVLTTGGAMQKIAFFLLLCLILYVSMSGTS